MFDVFGANTFHDTNVLDELLGWASLRLHDMYYYIYTLPLAGVP